MKKIPGDEFSFFANGEDALLPAGAALVNGPAAKLTADGFAQSFFGQASDIAQDGVGAIADIIGPATNLRTSIGMALDGALLSSAAITHPGLGLAPGNAESI